MQLALENPNSIGSWYLITENCDASLKIHPGLVIGHDDAHQFSLEPAHQVLTLDICANGNLHIRALNAGHRLQTNSAAMAESIVVEPGTPVQLDFFGHQILFDTDLVYVEDRVVLNLDLVNIHPPQGLAPAQEAEPDSTPPEQVAEPEPSAVEQESEPDPSRIEHDPGAHMLALDQDRNPKFILLEQDSDDSEAGSDTPPTSAAVLPQAHQVIDVTQESQPNSAFSAPEPGQEPGSGSTRLVWAAAISVLIIVMLLETNRHSEAPPTTTDTPSMDTPPPRQTAIGPPAESAAETAAKQPAAESLIEPVDQVLPADTDAVIDTPSASLALAATPADENQPNASPLKSSDPKKG